MTSILKCGILNGCFGEACHEVAWTRCCLESLQAACKPDGQPTESVWRGWRLRGVLRGKLGVRNPSLHGSRFFSGAGEQNVCPMLAHVGPMLALLNRILPERRLCWLYVRLSWTYPGPMLAVCCPRSALCEPYVGPCRPYVALYWPNLALSCPYVGPMFAYVGLP